MVENGVDLLLVFKIKLDKENGRCGTFDSQSFLR